MLHRSCPINSPSTLLCSYRVTARPDWKVAAVKQALFKGGIARANKPEGIRNTPGIQAGAGLHYLGFDQSVNQPINQSIDIL